MLGARKFHVTSSSNSVTMKSVYTYAFGDFFPSGVPFFDPVSVAAPEAFALGVADDDMAEADDVPDGAIST